jgi:hypothetical protein
MGVEHKPMREAARAVGLNVAVQNVGLAVGAVAPTARLLFGQSAGGGGPGPPQAPARAPAQVPPRPAQEADRAGAEGGGKRGRGAAAPPLPAHMPGSDADVIAQRMRAPLAEHVSYLHPSTATVHVNIDMWSTFYAPLLGALAWYLAGDTCRALSTTDYIVRTIGNFLGALRRVDSADILFAACVADEHGSLKQRHQTNWKPKRRVREIDKTISATMEGPRLSRGKVRRLRKKLRQHFSFLPADRKNEWALVLRFLLEASLTGHSGDFRLRKALEERGERLGNDVLRKVRLVRCADEDRHLCSGQSNVLIAVARDFDAAGSALAVDNDDRVVVWAALADGGRSVRVCDARAAKLAMLEAVCPAAAGLFTAVQVSRSAAAVPNSTLDKSAFGLATTVFGWAGCSDVGGQFQVPNKDEELRNLTIRVLGDWRGRFARACARNGVVLRLPSFLQWLQGQGRLGLMRGFVEDRQLQRRLLWHVYCSGARLLLGVGQWLNRSAEEEAVLVAARARMRDLCGLVQDLPEIWLWVSSRVFEVVSSVRFSRHPNERLKTPLTDALLAQLVQQRRAQPPPGPPQPPQQPPRSALPRVFLVAEEKLAEKERNGVFEVLQSLGNKRPGAKGVPRAPRPAAQKKKPAKTRGRPKREKSTTRPAPQRGASHFHGAGARGPSGKEPKKAKEPASYAARRVLLLRYYLEPDAAASVATLTAIVHTVVESILWPFGLLLSQQDSDLAGAVVSTHTFVSLFFLLPQFLRTGTADTALLSESDGRVSFWNGADACTVGGSRADVLHLLRRVVVAARPPQDVLVMLDDVFKERGLFKTFVDDMARTLARSFGLHLVKQLQLLSNAAMAEVARRHWPEDLRFTFNARHSEALTGVKALGSGDVERTAAPVSGLPAAVAEACDVGAALIRARVAAAAGLPSSSVSDVRLFAAQMGTVPAVYRASLAAVKAAEILYREFYGAYRGVMLYPVLRCSWKIHFPNQAFWRQRGEQGWEAFFTSNAKVAGRVPDFGAFRRNAKGAVEGGIMTDGVSLILYGKRPVKEQQRTESRTAADLKSKVRQEQLKCELAGPPNFLGKPFCSSNGVDGNFTGVMKLDAFLDIVKDPDVFDDRGVLVFDPGYLWALRGGFVMNDRLYSKLRISSRDFFHKTGRDNVERVGRELREKLVGEEGSERAYLASWERAERAAEAVLASEIDLAALMAEYELRSTQQHSRAKMQSKIASKEARYLFDKLLWPICKGFRHMGGRRKNIIMVGDEDDNKPGVKGTRSFVLSIILKFWAQFFLVLLCPERNTTNNCPNCHQKSEFAYPDVQKRTKVCRNCPAMGRDFFYDRDDGASLNIYHVAKHKAKAGGWPPLAFCSDWEREVLLLLQERNNQALMTAVGFTGQ